MAIKKCLSDRIYISMIQFTGTNIAEINELINLSPWFATAHYRRKDNPDPDMQNGWALQIPEGESPEDYIVSCNVGASVSNGFHVLLGNYVGYQPGTQEFFFPTEQEYLAQYYEIS